MAKVIPADTKNILSIMIPIHVKYKFSNISHTKSQNSSKKKQIQEKKDNKPSFVTEKACFLLNYIKHDKK